MAVAAGEWIGDGGKGRAWFWRWGWGSAVAAGSLARLCGGGGLGAWRCRRGRRLAVAAGNVLGVGEARLCGGGFSGALLWRRRRGRGSAVVAQTARAALERNTVARNLKSDAQSHLAAILAGVLLRTTLGRPQEMWIGFSEASVYSTRGLN